MCCLLMLGRQRRSAGLVVGVTGLDGAAEAARARPRSRFCVLLAPNFSLELPC